MGQQPGGGREQSVESEKPCLSRPGRGPEMVAIRPGRFLMGSPESEPQRQSDERPRHGVTIRRPFALGRCEVRVAELAAFIDDTGYVTDAERGKGCYGWDADAGNWAQRPELDWRNPGFEQDGDSPVVCVSWKDARAYAHWLALRTGRPYRLPTEAEWEYAARAGTLGPFWTGDCIHTDEANYDGSYDYNDCGAKTGLHRQRTVAVGTLKANPWGLYGVAGNAWEWVQDCWHDTYEDAPFDGRGWGEGNSGDCARRVVRGGGWFNLPRNLRSAYRSWNNPDVATLNVGFRLARTL
jgi:formylglycine-generating enzyme required for sulfatase activity